MTQKTLKRGILQRILGISATSPPADAGCWRLADNEIHIDLSRAAELSGAGGAIRLEKKRLSERVLVIRGDDDRFYAFHNKCKHMGRRLDPVPGAGTVQCCSVNKTTYDYEGKLLSGPAKGGVDLFEVRVEGNDLVVSL